MMETDQRAALAALIEARREDYAGLSRLIGRNPAYIQQFIRRGSPRQLAERDRQTLARYFGVEDAMLGGPPAEPATSAGLFLVPRLAIGASAGPGAMAEDERAVGGIGFDRRWLRGLTASPAAALSMIRVSGDSMEPALADGDDILVDRGDAGDRLRDGIYVLRREDAILVKRIALHPVAGRITVRSDNPRYPERECRADEIAVIGRVIWAGGRIG